MHIRWRNKYKRYSHPEIKEHHNKNMKGKEIVNDTLQREKKSLGWQKRKNSRVLVQ